MSRRTVLSAVAALVALFVLGAPGRAEPAAGFRLEDHVPASTLGFASIEGLGGWEQAVEKTALSKLGKDPEIQAFTKPIMEDVERLMEGMAGQQMGPAGKQGLDLLKELERQLQGLRGQVALAVVDVPPRGGMPLVAASLDFGEHVSDFREFLKRVAAETTAAFGAPVLQSVEREGRLWWVVGSDEGGIVATDVGSALVLSTDRAWLERVVASAGGKGDDPLGASPVFQDTRARSNVRGPAAWIYANLPRILEYAPMDAETRRVTRALGLDTVKALSYSVSIAGDGFLDTIVVHAPNADHGVVPLVRTKPTTHPFLPLVPANAFYYSGGSGAQPSETLPKIRQILRDVDPEIAAEAEEYLAKAKASLGVDVEKDLLAGLSGEGASYAALPETGGLYPEVVMFFGVKDAASFEPMLEKAVNGLAATVSEDGEVLASQRTIDYRGVKLHVVDLQFASGDDPLPFTPTWAIVGGRLVATLVPHTMKEIVLRAQQPTSGGGLSGQEDFRALMAAAPKDHGSLDYYDTQALFSLLYDTAVPLAQTLLKGNILREAIPVPIRVDLAQLPATRTIRPHLRSVAVYYTGDEGGMRFSIHAPVPMVGAMMLVAAVAIPMAVRQQRRGEELRRSIEVEAGDDDDMPGPVARGGVSLDDVAAKIVAHGKAMGALPATLDELVGPGKTFTALPRDEWGTPIRYKAVDRDEAVFELRSAGPNRVLGDLDDVVRQFESD